MRERNIKGLTAHLHVACLLAAITAAPSVWAEEPAESGEAPQSESVKPPEEARKPPVPKATEYDKLPPEQLVQRAQSGDLKAQFELGSRINYGRGMPKNAREALRWLRRAAQSGQQDAQRLLAVKFYNGFDVPVDHAEALRWTVQLAEAGDVPAQLSAANMYASGEGSERNLVRAYMWYSIAAATAGTEGAPEGVEKAAQSAAEQRDKMTSLLLPEQEVEAQQLSSDWWLKKQGVSLTEKPASSAKPSKSERKH